MDRKVIDGMEDQQKNTPSPRDIDNFNYSDLDNFDFAPYRYTRTDLIDLV